MRSYSEAIERQAKRMFSMYMGGSNDLRVDGSMISYIFGVPEKEVDLHIQREYKKISKEYYHKVNNENR